MGVRIIDKPEKLLELYDKYKDKEIAITTHKNADIDAVVSALLARIMFPKAKLYIQDRMNSPALYLIRWLEKRFGIVAEFKKLSESKEKLVIVVDTCGNAELYSKQLIAIFDHHKKVNCKFSAEFEFMYSNAAANSLILLNALEMLSEKRGLSLPKWVYDATAIALISDTNKFSRANPETFRIMSELLEKSTYSYEELEMTAMPPPSLEDITRLDFLLGGNAVIDSYDESKLNDLKITEYNRPYIIVVNRHLAAYFSQLLPTLPFSPGDITSDIMNITKLPFVIVIKEYEEGIRLSIRTRPPYDAVEFMKKYLDCKENCGGHPRAGGGSFNIPKKELIKKIVYGIIKEGEKT